MRSGTVAIITTSGRFYYRLVSELKKRNIAFLSLTPNDPIPAGVNVVLTTTQEQSKISHFKILAHDVDSDLRPLIEKLIQTMAGKDRYTKLVLGVDPGKRTGLVVMGDGTIISNMVLTKNVVSTIVEMVNLIDAEKKIVKIGAGTSTYHSSLLELLDKELPLAIDIESINEKGTSRHFGFLSSNKKRLKDIEAAIRISQRKGHRLNRKKKHV